MATETPAKVAVADAAAPESKPAFVKPEKPDEASYKEGLAKLEKAHSEAQQKFVRRLSFCDHACIG